VEREGRVGAWPLQDIVSLLRFSMGVFHPRVNPLLLIIIIISSSSSSETFAD